MEFALDQNNQRIRAFDAIKGKNYFCPTCHKQVCLKRGEINIDHFAHLTKCEDNWHYDMSLWHSQWQNQFPLRNQEVVINSNGELHRADVMACGYVIEFQHSSITAEEFNERNTFYINYGKKVIWVFDFIDEFDSKQISFYEEWGNKYDNGAKYKWKYPKRFLQGYLPQRDRNIIVFFQFFTSDHSNKESCYMERITWAIEEDEYSDFRRFCTSYYPSNSIELLDYIKAQKL